MSIPIFGSTDVLLMGILRRWFAAHPEIHIGTLFSKDMKPPIIVARRDPKNGAPGTTSDDANLRPALITISCITEGLEAEAQGEQIQEAIHSALLTAVKEQWVIQGHGSISAIKNRSPYSRKSDWQSSTGIVQYASLPKEYVRMESVYLLMLRPPRPETITNPYIPSAS